MRIITKELRRLLKKPIGLLVPSDKVTAFLKEQAHRTIISVGDSTSLKLLASKIQPSIMVFDLKIRRRPVSKKEEKILLAGPRIDCVNPAGMITSSLEKAVALALKKGQARIFVIGEEDLAVIPLMMLSPDGLLILYGQPGKGLVAIETDGMARQVAKAIYERFEQK